MKKRAKNHRSQARVTAGLLLMVAAAGVQANLNDPPYFNLWTAGQTIDGLTGDGTSVVLCGVAGQCGGSGAAIFDAVATMPAGTGYIQPFLRFQHDTAQGQNSPVQPYLEPANGDARGVEGAYNTDSRSRADGQTTVHGLEYDSDFLNQAHDANQWNHALKLSDLTEIDGRYHFFLDVNEPGVNSGNRTLRLDELMFFVAEGTGANMMNDFDPALETLKNGATMATKVWDMDVNGEDADGTPDHPPGKGAGDNYGGVILDGCQGDKGCGSGDFELRVSLDANLFKNAVTDANNAYVYLYNYAGQADALEDGTEAFAGFEEWSADVSGGGPPGDQVPAPASLMLMVGGLATLARRRRRRQG